MQDPFAVTPLLDLETRLRRMRIISEFMALSHSGYAGHTAIDFGDLSFSIHRDTEDIDDPYMDRMSKDNESFSCRGSLYVMQSCSADKSFLLDCSSSGTRDQRI
jgi:hypothetical protein